MTVGVRKQTLLRPYMNEIRSIGVVPSFTPPEFQYSSAMSTASEPRDTLSAPERK